MLILTVNDILWIIAIGLTIIGIIISIIINHIKDRKEEKDE